MPLSTVRAAPKGIMQPGSAPVGILLENCDDTAFETRWDRSAHYQIVVRGELSDRFAHAFLR